MDRFDVMVTHLAGLPLPPLPEIQGRVIQALTPTDDDPPAAVWDAEHPVQSAAFMAELDAEAEAKRERAAESRERRSAALRAAWARRRAASTTTNTAAPAAQLEAGND